MEQVDVDHEHTAERQRWRNGDEWDERAVKVAVGQLAGGRWYVRAYGGGISRPACAYRDHAEHFARSTARRWMRTIGGDWTSC